MSLTLHLQKYLTSVVVPLIGSWNVQSNGATASSSASASATTRKSFSSCAGLDLVPLHPDLSLLRSSDLGSRIKWVQVNCLERLPFANEEFDFVHIKRLAHGIPEDKVS
jgi:ubiquinone/menaquinone biosynthesis C-methylase UbiE